MTMRALVQRNTNAGADPTGNPGVPSWTTHLAAMPCRTWFDGERQVTDGEKTAAIEDRKLICPRGTDIRPGDRILNVKNRLGEVEFTGPAKIEAAGNRKDHIELSLEEVT